MRLLRRKRLPILPGFSTRWRNTEDFCRQPARRSPRQRISLIFRNFRSIVQSHQTQLAQGIILIILGTSEFCNNHYSFATHLLSSNNYFSSTEIRYWVNEQTHKTFAAQSLWTRHSTESLESSIIPAVDYSGLRL